MNKLKPILLLTLLLAMFLHCGVFKDNTKANSEIDTTKTVVTETNITDVHTGETIINNNTENVTVTGETLGENVKNGENGKDTIPIDFNIDLTKEEMQQPEGTQITVPLPQIITDLFPDLTWELVVNNDGMNKFYRTYIGNRPYGADVINDLVFNYYKLGELSEKEFVELFICLKLHPYDNNVKVLSTTYYENKIKDYYNYLSIVEYNGQQVEFYSLMMDKKYHAFAIYLNGVKTKCGPIN